MQPISFAGWIARLGGLAVVAAILVAPLLDDDDPATAQSLQRRSTLTGLAADSAAGQPAPSVTVSPTVIATATPVTPVAEPTGAPEPDPTPYDPYYPY